jgi:hypothetical protein
MTSSLHNCGGCQSPLTKHDFPQDPSIVFTCCVTQEVTAHVFHKNCVSQWALQPKETCPLCRAPLYSHQLGKTTKQLLTIFLEALQKDPETIIQALQSSNPVADECSVCSEDFPFISLRYNPDTQRFYHPLCCSNTHPQLSMQNFAKVIAAVVNRYPHLREKFTPAPLNLWQSFQLDYPQVSQALAPIGIVAACALLMFTQYGSRSTG